MAQARVTFHKLIQDSQDIGTGEDHMISKAFFTLELDGNVHNDMCVELKQPFGTDYETEPVEVFRPTGSYSGNWNQHAFADAAEDYYRGLIGSQGRVFAVGKGTRMRNNTMEINRAYAFDVP